MPFAIDDELYSEIVNSSNEATTTLQQRLVQNVKDQYISDFQYYLAAVRCNKIKLTPGSTILNDSQQSTLDLHLKPISKNQNQNLRHVERLRREHRIKTFALLEATNATKDDIDFSRLILVKKPRNGKDTLLKGIGVKKLEALIDKGIKNGAALLAFNDVAGDFNNSRGESLLKVWKHKVKHVFNERRRRLREAEKEYDKITKEMEEAEDELERGDPSNDINNQPSEDVGEAAIVEIAPKFSELEDSSGYNARFLSRKHIDRILVTEYHHRKPVQQGKLFGLGAELLKMDFNYKLSKKIRVWQGRGSSFQPYKSFLTIQNEDGLTVFWKGLKGAESIVEIEMDLKALKERLCRIPRRTLRPFMLTTAATSQAS